MRNYQKVLLGVVTSIIMGVSALGIQHVAAQEAGQGSIVSRVAEILNISEGSMKDAFKQAGMERVDQAIADGKITSEEAIKIKERIESSEGMGILGMRGMHDRRQQFGVGGIISVKEVLEEYGISHEYMQEAREQNKSLSEILTEKKISIDEFKISLKSNAEEKINQAYQNGEMDEERKNMMLDNLDERIENILNSIPGQRQNKMHALESKEQANSPRFDI